jgi:hypothetical protein
LLSFAAVLIAAGVPMGPVVLFGGALAIAFAYRYPYAVYGLMVGLVPFLGVTVSLPTGELAFSQRVFGGSIDVTVVEVVAAALFAAWGLKVVGLWFRRRDISWKPWLPLALPMIAVVVAHLCSALSPYHPDPLLIIKYSLRPVLWCYLIYVVLTVNVIRSRRRLTMVLGVMTATGLFASVMGFISLGIPDHGGALFSPARPLPLFGTTPLGDNHNLLAEWLVVTIPCTIVLAVLSRDHRARRLLAAAALFQTVIALLTFARTAWIVISLEAVLIALFVWREQFMLWIRPVLISIVLLIPVGAAMTAFTRTATVASSTSTRVMLTQIALNLWKASPWVGMGAGTFVDRVGSTQVFVIEYGAPLDSHGFLQKLLAETGVLGVAAMAWLVWTAFQFVRTQRMRLHAHHVEWQAFTILAISSFGAFTYQLFNTNYWSGKLWLPLGVLFAAARALSAARSDQADESAI